MPIKSKLCCCPFSHLIPCLVCTLYNPNRRQLFLWGSPGEVWLILSRRLLSHVAVYLSHPLLKKKIKGGRRANHGELLPLLLLVRWFSLALSAIDWVGMLKAESSQCWKLSNCKTVFQGKKCLSALYELLYIHEHNFILSPLEGCWGTVLVVEITVFGHTVFSFTMVSIPQVCLKTGQGGAADRLESCTWNCGIKTTLLPSALFPLSLATYFHWYCYNSVCFCCWIGLGYWFRVKITWQEDFEPSWTSGWFIMRLCKQLPWHRRGGRMWKAEGLWGVEEISSALQ